MALGSTHPLTEMSTGNNFLGGEGGWCVGLTNLPPSYADCLELWVPQTPGTLRACPYLLRDCFTFDLWDVILCCYAFVFEIQKSVQDCLTQQVSAAIIKGWVEGGSEDQVTCCFPLGVRRKSLENVEKAIKKLGSRGRFFFIIIKVLLLGIFSVHTPGYKNDLNCSFKQFTLVVTHPVRVLRGLTYKVRCVLVMAQRAVNMGRRLDL